MATKPAVWSWQSDPRVAALMGPYKPLDLFGDAIDFAEKHVPGEGSTGFGFDFGTGFVDTTIPEFHIPREGGGEGGDGGGGGGGTGVPDVGPGNARGGVEGGSGDRGDPNTDSDNDNSTAGGGGTGPGGLGPGPGDPSGGTDISGGTRGANAPMLRGPQNDASTIRAFLDLVGKRRGKGTSVDSHQAAVLRLLEGL